jgi:hypothetical protein
MEPKTTKKKVIEALDALANLNLTRRAENGTTEVTEAVGARTVKLREEAEAAAARLQQEEVRLRQIVSTWTQLQSDLATAQRREREVKEWLSTLDQDVVSQARFVGASWGVHPFPRFDPRRVEALIEFHVMREHAQEVMAGQSAILEEIETRAAAFWDEHGDEIQSLAGQEA